MTRWTCPPAGTGDYPKPSTDPGRGSSRVYSTGLAPRLAMASAIRIPRCSESSIPAPPDKAAIAASRYGPNAQWLDSPA